MNKGILQITEIEEISIPNVLKDKMKNLIENELKTHNPYTCDQEIAAYFSKEWLNCLIDYSKKNPNSDMKNLLHIIKIANCGGNVPPTLIKILHVILWKHYYLGKIAEVLIMAKTNTIE